MSTATTQSGPIRILTRGIMRRCPRCGSGRLFRKWFDIVERCPRCGLRFEHEEGYWAGALAVNIGVTAAVFAVGFVIALVLTVPDVPVVPLLLIFAPLMVIVPIVGYPFSKTVWMALDDIFSGEDELDIPQPRVHREG